MICPYCQGTMQKGFIYSGKTDICWTPIEEQQSWLINHPTEKQIPLAKLHYLKGCKIIVFRCPTCKIEIINEKDATK